MTKAELIQSIYNAFRGVKLEDGIGLLEAEMIDDWYEKDSPEYIKARQKDEREDWSKLLPIFFNQDKNENYVTHTWACMNAKGILFHLPCFLLQDIECTFHHGDKLWYNPLIYTITLLYKDSGTEFSSFDRLKILNAAQRKVVIDFLDYKIEQFSKEKRKDDMLEYQRAKDNFVKYLVNKS